MEPTAATIERYRRGETSVEAALVEMYIAGVSVDVTNRSRGTTHMCLWMA